MSELNFNVFNVIILAGIIHGVIFSLVIFFNKNLKSKANYFLASTILSLTLSNLQYWLIDTNIIPRIYFEQNLIIYIPFEFLILPFFYFFVKSFIQQKVLIKQITYIFFPFIFSIIYILIRNFISNDILVVKYLNIIVEYISIIFSIVLILLIFVLLVQHEKEIKTQKLTEVLIKTKWLKKSLLVGGLLCILWFFSFNIFGNYLNKGYYKYYPLWIGIAILMYWIGYTAILQKHLYNERVEIRSKISNKKRQNRQLNNESPSNLSTTSFNKMDFLVRERKLHLNPNLTLKSLAGLSGFSSGYISQLINEYAQLNFNDYINTLRINEAKYMLKEREYDNYTMAAIGLEVGFNSKSSFYSAFKKFTDKTPVEYKKGVRNL